ncbi:TonB-dependent receptor [Coraliomargarita sp. W4R72]
MRKLPRVTLPLLSLPLFSLAVTCAQAELGIQELEPFYVRAAPATKQIPGRDLLGDSWRQSGTVGLAEALEAAEPGLSLVRKGGMSNDVVLRGLGGDDLSVTLDNRKIFCACSNRMDPPLSHATAETAARVEIAAGPFSLKRSGSLGGHINIVSAEIEPGWHGVTEFGIGTYGQQNHSTWMSYADDTFAVKVQAGYLTGDPYETGSGQKVTELPTGTAAYQSEYIDATAYEAWHVGGEVEWKLSEDDSLRLNVLRREDRDLLFPGLRMDADSTETTQLGLRYQHDAPAGPFETWVLDTYFNDTEHLMSDSRRVSQTIVRPGYDLTRGYFMQTDANARNWGSTFDAEIETKRFGSWNVGAEWGQRQWDSDNVIYNINNAMLPDVLSTTVGAYAQGHYQFESPWSLELGLRADYFYSEARGDTTLLQARQGTDSANEQVEPGAFASLRYQWTETTALFAGLGSVARAPNPQELYIQVDKPGANADWLGNPDLDAPRSTELTAGIERLTDDWEMRVRVFHSWLDNYIYPVDDGGMQSYANIDARLWGAEFSAAHQFNDNWSLSAGLAWQRGVKDTGTDRDLAEIPPLRAQVALQYQSEQTLLKAEVRASDRQEQIDTSLNESTMDAWATLSLYARRKLDEHWTLALAAENLFDKDYALHNAQVRDPFSTSTIVNEPGRILKASLSYEF